MYRISKFTKKNRYTVSFVISERMKQKAIWKMKKINHFEGDCEIYWVYLLKEKLLNLSEFYWWC